MRPVDVSKSQEDCGMLSENTSRSLPPQRPPPPPQQLAQGGQELEVLQGPRMDFTSPMTGWSQCAVGLSGCLGWKGKRRMRVSWVLTGM